EAHVGDALPVGAAEVRHQDHLRVLLAQELDGRQRLLETPVRLPLPPLERDIEVDAHDDALASDVQIFDEQFLAGAHGGPGFSRGAGGLSRWAYDVPARTALGWSAPCCARLRTHSTTT